MEKDKKCIQCGSKDKLFQLESGYYVCKKCLDEVGEEQKKIQNHILNYLAEYDLTSPEEQINVLEGIAMSIRFNNKLLSDEQMKAIQNAKERMDKAFE